MASSRSHRPVRTTVRRLVMLALLLGLATPAAAVQIVVTTTQDENNTDGDCSLREAMRAANVNTTRDACPAGSSATTDEIVLAADAVYSLTIAGSDNLGLVGGLVFADNPASTDVEITVASGGTATISQDAVPDTRVLSISPTAKVLMEGVVVEGGSVNDKGGGIFVGSNAHLGLTRCGVRFNRAGDNGGGIRNGGGTLVVEDSTFDHNVSAVAGGAISNASATVTLIKDSLFADNEALGQFGGGGAIESADQISIVGSVFVNNRARTLGGAIVHFHEVANEASISQSCLVGNEAGFTGNAIDVFAGSQVLNAAGNWWGANDGPSGEGDGSGDGVDELIDFDPPNTFPHPECLPLELVANGGFQSDGDADGIPQRWTPSLLAPADGRACAETGACVVKLRGNAANKQLAHVIRHAGVTGDAFTFRARSRAKDVPTSGGSYRALVTIVHDDGSKQDVALNFSPGKHGFERLTKSVVAAEDYSEIRVRIDYGRAGGVVRFDSVSLVLEPE